MPTLHCQLVDMQLWEWDLRTCNFNKNIFHPRCSYSLRIDDRLPFHPPDASTRHFLYKTPQTTPLCLLSLGVCGEQGRILETPRSTDLGTIWHPTQYLWLSVSYQLLQKALLTHILPQGSLFFLLNMFSLYQVEMQWNNFCQLVLNLHPFIFPKLPRHHWRPRPPV